MIDDLHVSYEKFRKIYKKAKELNMKELSFEFLVGSCFPQALENIKQEMRRQYTLGYAQGRKDAEDELIEKKTEDNTNDISR